MTPGRFSLPAADHSIPVIMECQAILVDMQQNSDVVQSCSCSTQLCLLNRAAAGNSHTKDDCQNQVYAAGTSHGVYLLDLNNRDANCSGLEHKASISRAIWTGKKYVQTAEASLLCLPSLVDR